jgi:hypothetical protein
MKDFDSIPKKLVLHSNDIPPFTNINKVFWLRTIAGSWQANRNIVESISKGRLATNGVVSL